MRPSKLKPEVRDRLLKAIRLGAPLEVACNVAGASYRAVAEWIQRGEGRHPNRPSTPDYVQFAQEVTRAIADSEMRLLSIVNKGAEQDPRHAQWLLSRRFPERWAETHRVSVQVQEGMQVGFNLFFERVLSDRQIPDDAKARILQHAVDMADAAAVGELN